ncbi:methionyl-tRNA formyltransferase [Marinicrinis sediminis]|uniref:Methionyl-tRNA formyltransferase n=1 Tax=Marinicrinis sediminis TaxID=1652465 RepID=A0ABW5R6M7_9BACL
MTKPNAGDRIVFMGTPDFAVPCLKGLMEAGYQVVGVVTQPDRPKGRKRVLTPPPVKEAALAYHLPVLQPEKIRTAYEEVLALEPDLIVTAAYGQILPVSLLEQPKHGAINVHASLLPAYRGAAPIQYAIMNGDEETGVTIMYMEQGLDTGDMIAKVAMPIQADDDAGTLFDKLSAAGASLLLETLPRLLAGEITAVPQNDEDATYARTLKRDDERLDWERKSKQLHDQVRAMSPWPGAFTTYQGDGFKVWKTRMPAASEMENWPWQQAQVGEVVAASAVGMAVRTGDGVLVLEEIQPAGKKRMTVQAYLAGKGIQVGERFGGVAE